LVILHRKSNPDVNAFMADNDISTYEQLESYFIQNVVNLLDTLDSKYLVWEEVFLNGVTLPNSTVVHVWRGGGLETLAAVGFFLSPRTTKNELLTFRRPKLANSDSTPAVGTWTAWSVAATGRGSTTANLWTSMAQTNRRN
jgi:hypothetical protein